MQDDLENWRTKSALMADVHGNAIVNIATTHAMDGSGRLFADQDVPKARRNLVQLPEGKL